MAGVVSARFTVPNPIRPMRLRAAKPFAGGVGAKAIQTMLNGGAGSIVDQVGRWDKGHAFGSFKPQGGGSLGTDWKRSSLRKVADDRISVGTRNPLANIYQGRHKLQRITEKQRLFLGMEFGVWLKRSHVFKKRRGRRIMITAPMARRVERIIFAGVTGEKS